MAWRSSRSMIPCQEVHGEYRLDSTLVFEEYGRDLVHGLDLLKALFDHRLAFVGLRNLSRR
jgi:hypothetical protein